MKTGMERGLEMVRQLGPPLPPMMPPFAQPPPPPPPAVPFTGPFPGMGRTENNDNNNNNRYGNYLVVLFNTLPKSCKFYIENRRLAAARNGFACSGSVAMTSATCNIVLNCSSLQQITTEILSRLKLRPINGVDSDLRPDSQGTNGCRRGKALPVTCPCAPTRESPHQIPDMIEH